MTRRFAAAAASIALLPACASLGVRKGGFNLVSVEEEWRMRDGLREEVARQYTLERDEVALEYLNEVGRRIARQTDLGQLPWDFGLVRDDAINAFNLPGGLVYVNTGLVRRAETLDQLTGVLAHEVAHGAARHGTQLMTRAYGYSVVAGLVLGSDPGAAERLLAQLVGTGVLRDYGRDAEREADELGVGYSYAAGYDPRGMPAFFRLLQEERRSRPSALEQFFSSHPVTEERIRETEAQIARLPERRLVHDTEEYRRFRERFR